MPIVAVAQLFLSRALRPDGGIVVDGAFGPRTKEAVKQFQVRQGLNPSGIIDGLTWQRLNSQNGQIIDSVDATENVDERGRMRGETDRHREWEETDIREAGGRPIVHYGMTNGFGHVLQRIRSSSTNGNTILLRLHGHGSPGNQVLSSGKMGGVASEIASDFIDWDYIRDALRILRPIFSPFASVQMMGCKVGRGAGGLRLLAGLAETWNVPVSAGVNTQLGGGPATFVFEGPVRTVFPNGLNLRTWAAQLPGANICL